MPDDARPDDARRSTVADDGRGLAAEKPTDIPKQGWKDIALRVKGAIKKDHTQLAASGVAFWAFVSSIPALLAAITIYGLVADPDDVQERINDLIGDAAPDEVREMIAGQLENIAGQAGGALTFGLITSLVAALWTASTGMQRLMEGVSMAYGEQDTRGFVKKRALALALTLGAIVFVLLALAAVAAVPALLGATELPGAVQWLLSLVVWPVLALVLIAGLAVVYRYGPDRRNAEWRWVSWGAGIAVVMWVLASIGFQIYVANFGNYNETYGALAGVIIFLFWLFISCLAILVGAEINAEMERQTAADTTTAEPDRPSGPARPMPPTPSASEPATGTAKERANGRAAGGAMATQAARRSTKSKRPRPAAADPDVRSDDWRLR